MNSVEYALDRGKGSRIQRLRIGIDRQVQIRMTDASITVNRREIVTPDRRQILTPYSRCLKRQESFPVSMISQ